jgi:hypothetical protein
LVVGCWLSVTDDNHVKKPMHGKNKYWITSSLQKEQKSSKLFFKALNFTVFLPTGRCDRVAPGLGTTNLLPPIPLPLLPLTVSEFLPTFCQLYYNFFPTF